MSSFKKELVVSVPMSDDEIRAHVAALLADKGENALTQNLQQRIQKTKKIESETAALIKKAAVEKAQADGLRDESTKLLAKARAHEQHCSLLGKEVSDWPERRDARVAEWAERMGSVSANVESEAAALSAKMDADDVIIAEKEAENAVLKERFDSLRTEFDDAFKAYEVSWKAREEQTKETIVKLQELHHCNDTLKAHGILQDKHVQRLTEAITAYSQQLEMYESRFDEVEGSAMRSDDIKKLADKQQQQIQDQLDQVEANRKMDVDEKRRYDDEAQKLRARYQQVKKRSVLLEKAKLSAESKCRDAQKKAAAAAAKK